jgi:hypothetical protein
MKLGASIFNATYETFPDLHAQLRVNRKTVVERCIVASVGSERVATDQGLALTPDISLRLLTDDVPAIGCKVGDIAEVSRDDGTTFSAYQIAAIHESAGMTRLTMKDRHAG